MEYTTLGRTGLQVSRMGLGCGGHSRLGTATGKSEAEAEQVVREALALGINFIDTAESYRTEEIVGRGIKGSPRDQIVISTKAGVDWQDRLSTADELRGRIDACLKRLGTDYIDVFHLHGVSTEEYGYACLELLPALREMKSEGKIRFIGITEAFASDPSHKMLAPAVMDDFWDVVMVGFNIINQSARKSVLAQTQKTNVGTLCMFAVRRALSRPDALTDLMRILAEQGIVDASAFDPDRPLGFLVGNGVAESIEDAAYRFCRWEPGMDMILSGTGNIQHLKSNARSINRPPLPEAVSERLREMFKKVDAVSGN